MSYVVLTEASQALIRRARVNKGYSQARLADRATVALNTVKRIETAAYPRVQETGVLRICSALGLAAADVLEEHGVLGQFEKGQREGPPLSRIRVFIAAPVTSAGLEYEQVRKVIIPIARAVRALVDPGEVFCAVEERTSVERLEDEALALAGNLRRLERSDRLLAFHFAPRVTSVFVEVGIALALRIPTMVLVKDRSHLPWMLKGHSTGDPPYRVTRFRDASDVLQLIAQEEEWFRGIREWHTESMSTASS